MAPQWNLNCAFQVNFPSFLLAHVLDCRDLQWAYHTLCHLIKFNLWLSVFQLIAILLIGVAAYAKVISLVRSFHIIGAVIACGVFLLLIACMGFLGAVKHHQICLFFVSFHLSSMTGFVSNELVPQWFQSVNLDEILTKHVYSLL